MKKKTATALTVLLNGALTAALMAQPNPIVESRTSSSLGQSETSATARASDAEIDALHTMVVNLELTVHDQRVRIQNGIEWRENLQQKLYASRRATRAAMETNDAPTLAEQDVLWMAGYWGFGGRNRDEFAQTILPCESGSEPGAHAAHGDKTLGDSLGRAQIHRPTWEESFEAIFDVDYDVGVVNPVLNGAMAAHVEQQQGLSAWTCYRESRQ